MPTYRYVVKLKNGKTRTLKSNKELSREQVLSIAKSAPSAGEYQVKLQKSGAQAQASTWEPSKKDLGGEKFNVLDLVKEPVNIARDVVGGAEFLAGAATYLPTAPILGEQNFIARTGKGLMQAGKKTMSPEARVAWVENPRKSAPALEHGVRQGMRAASYVMPAEGAGEAAIAGAVNAMSNARNVPDAVEKGVGGAVSGALFSKLVSALSKAPRKVFSKNAVDVRAPSNSDILATRLMTSDVVSSSELRRADKFLGADRIAKVMRDFGITPDVRNKGMAEAVFAREANRHRELLDEAGAQITSGDVLASIISSIKDKLLAGGTAHDRRTAEAYAESLLGQLRLVGGANPAQVNALKQDIMSIIENRGLTGRELGKLLDTLADAVSGAGGERIPPGVVYDMAQANRKNFTRLLNSNNEVGATIAHKAYLDLLKLLDDRLVEAGMRDIAEHGRDVAALGMVASGLGKKYAQTLARHVGPKNTMQVASAPIQAMTGVALSPTNRMLLSKALSRTGNMGRRVKNVFIPQSHKLFRRR